MAYMSYAQQLRHPNWQRRRLERLAVADFQCDNCGAIDITLHVHHPRYVRGRMAWEYSDDELQVLCEGCHGEHHAAEEVLMSLMAGGHAHSIFGIVAGYLRAELSDDCRSKLLAAGCMEAYDDGNKAARR